MTKIAIAVATVMTTALIISLLISRGGLNISYRMIRRPPASRFFGATSPT